MDTVDGDGDGEMKPPEAFQPIGSQKLSFLEASCTHKPLQSHLTISDRLEML